MKKAGQRSLCCPCGRSELLALGLWSTCYTLRRQDEEYFGGLRGQVLERDEYTVNLPGCLIGIEACAGAHALARALVAQGHNVKLMPAEYEWSKLPWA